MNPSLLLIPDRYKAAKLYSQIPDSGAGDLTFARNSSATRVNSAGLIEKVRTNLILQSEAFNTTWNVVSMSVTPNTTANPLNAALTADTITLSAGTIQKYIEQGIVLSGNFTASVYLKAGTHQFVQFLLGTDPAPFANFDLVNGTASATSSTASIVAVGNGWYRCSMSFTSVIGTNIIMLGIDSLGATRFLPTASTGTYIAFGYQLETGDIATDYIPTTTAAVSVGITADIPRLDYTGGGCPSLLLEPQRTNLALYSEQFNNAAWSPTRAVVTANQIISPDGFANADLITDTTFTNNQNFTEQSIAVSNANVTYSIFVKKGTADFVSFGFFDTAFHGFVVNTTTWLSTQTFGSASLFQAINYGNGWYRLSMNKTASTNFIFTSVAVQQNSTGANYNGTGSLSAYFWGAQVEAGAYPTSYIPTLGSSVTRLADVASKTGISSLIGQASGTLYVEADLTHSAAFNEYLIQVSADSDNRFFIYREGTTNKLGCFARVGASTIYTTLTASAATGTIKAAFAYQSGSFAFYVNGVQVGISSATYATPSSIGRFDLDQNDGTENGFYSYNGAGLYTTRLSNAELATLTSL
jgi:hypothetical protein